MIAALLAGSASVLAVAFAGGALGSPAVAKRPSPSYTRGRTPLPPVVGTLAGVAVGIGVGLTLAGPIGLVILGVAGGAVPTVIRRRRAARVTVVLERQLLELVVSLAATLRAGRSLEQALAAAAEELAAPLGASVTRIVDRTALGTSLDASIDVWATELDSVDARLIAGVLSLHRRTGGALAGPLDELSTTLRSRGAAARELRSLTAQARLSAAILGLLPIGFFLFLSTVSRRDIEAAVSTPAGAAAVVIGLGLQGAAFVWIRSLLRAGER